MSKDNTATFNQKPIYTILDINPHVHKKLMEFGDIGENAFDVYTLYKSAAKRKFSDIVPADDKLGMKCLAWMTTNEFYEAKRLLRKLGYITEIIDQGEYGTPEIRYVNLGQRTRRIV